MDDVLVESGTNISIGCPGMTRNTFVVQIEWVCVGVCGSTKKLPRDSVHSLLKYVKDQGTSVYKNKKRLRLDQDLFALEFDPVTSLDAGRYKCLINNRPSPEAMINLKVLGKKSTRVSLSFFRRQGSRSALTFARHVPSFDE